METQPTSQRNYVHSTLTIADKSPTFAAMSSHDALLRGAVRFLGPDYGELAPGVFRSADGLRQFRMTTSDLMGAHGRIGPHVNFEALNPQGRVIENLHVPIRE